jgi:hypothetical protein
MPSSIQSADAIARLENCRRMITLDEAVEILTARKPLLFLRFCEAAGNFRLDINDAAEAPLCKVEDADDGELMIPPSELELVLQEGWLH